MGFVLQHRLHFANDDLLHCMGSTVWAKYGSPEPIRPLFDDDRDAIAFLEFVS